MVEGSGHHAGGPAAPAADAGLAVTLDLRGARCLVAGGGAVAAHKVEVLLGAGARVTVVAAEVGPALAALVAEADATDGDALLTVAVRPVEAGDVPGHLLVVCATGDPVADDTLAGAARAAGALVNRADGGSPQPGAVDLAAVHRAGPVTVAVSTGGSSPALARWVRDRVAAVVGPDVADLAGLLEEARRQVAATGRPTRSVDWSAAINQAAPLVAAGRTEEARAVLARLAGTSGLADPAGTSGTDGTSGPAGGAGSGPAAPVG